MRAHKGSGTVWTNSFNSHKIQVKQALFTSTFHTGITQLVWAHTDSSRIRTQGCPALTTPFEYLGASKFAFLEPFVSKDSCVAHPEGQPHICRHFRSFSFICGVDISNTNIWLILIGRTDAEAETPILRPPHAKSWLIGKDPDAGRVSGQEEKGMTEDEMAGWHHQLDRHEFE